MYRYVYIRIHIDASTHVCTSLTSAPERAEMELIGEARTHYNE